MSFRSIVCDVRDGIGSLSRRSFDFRLSALTGFTGHNGRKSRGSVHELHDQPEVVQQSLWASLPPELVRYVIERLEECESTWPSRKHVVVCAAVCRSWRKMCKEVVRNPEFCGQLTFPGSLKQPGPRNGTIQCFIKRDKHMRTYHLYLCLSPVVLDGNGKFLLSARRKSHTTSREYTFSMNPDNISRSDNYIGGMRSDFLGTKFTIYDSQPPNNAASDCADGHSSRRFSPEKDSLKVPTGSYLSAEVMYRSGHRGLTWMQCIMHSIPASALDPGGAVTGQPNQHMSRSSRSSIMDHSMNFSSAHCSDVSGAILRGKEAGVKESSLVLRNKAGMWSERLQCWGLDFRGRVTVPSVKNFQLVASTQAAAMPLPPVPSQPSSSDHDKIILQYGKATKDMFTMEYSYPLSAFQAFAICLTRHNIGV